MYYLLLDQIIPSIKNIWLKATDCITSPWTLIIPDTIETKIQINSLATIYTTYQPYQEILEQIQEDDYIFYFILNENQQWFPVEDAEQWKWFFSNIDEVMKPVQENKPPLVFIPWCPIYQDNHFLTAFYNLIQGTLPPKPNELLELLHFHEPSLKIETPGFKQWIHPSPFIQSYLSNESFHINEEYSHKLIYFLKHQFIPGIQPTYSREKSPFTYIIHGKTLKENPIEYMPIKNWLSRFDKSVRIDLFQWIPLMRRLLYRVSNQHHNDPFPFFQEICRFHNYFNYPKDVSTVMLSKRKVPTQFIWYPFQEEFTYFPEHSLKVQNGPLLDKAIASQLKITQRHLSVPNLVQSYEESFENISTMVHVYRSTDWTDFNWDFWWRSHLQNFASQDLQSCTSTYYLKKKQLFTIVWVWDYFSCPFLFRFTLPQHIEHWKVFITKLLTKLTTSPYYYRNDKNQPVVFVALPTDAIPFFLNLLPDIDWRVIVNYPIRDNGSSLLYQSTLTSCSIPGYPTIEFKEMGKYFPYQLGDYYWRHKKRFDQFCLNIWEEWYFILDESRRRVFSMKPIINHIKDKSIWIQWNIPESLTKYSFYNILHRAQRSQIFVIGIYVGREGEREGHRGEWWNRLPLRTSEEGFRGWLVNESIIEKEPPRTYKEGCDLIEFLWTRHNPIFPNWIPFENLREE